ncbi:SAV_2336 N-terminal domain-related protein [Streptomyces sp. NPDC047002]|uniref:SAV_2336 N-terminal domain-related protein n=1 Tax=Streptomyces sp. NPDC047002 TaxID=3155475 RepID=UPI0034515D68
MSGVPARDGGPGSPAAPGGERAALAAFVGRLRQAGLDPDARQLLDVLWLAGHLAPAPGPGESPAPPDAGGAQPGENGGDGVRGGPDGGNTPPVEGTDGTAAPHGPGRPPADPRIALGAPRVADGSDGLGAGTRGVPSRAGLAPGVPGGAVLPLGVPTANALPATLGLQRALRPLQRYRRPAAPVESVLDEAATADLSARAGGLIMPVHRAEPRPDVDLQLVMDVSSSMLVWQRLIAELEEIFSHLGAFRDVRTRYLHQGPDGEPAVSAGLDPRAAALGPAERLCDPTGGRITILVSDCAGPLWYSGQAHRLLHRLAGLAPVAVLQPLPQRLWSRTALPVTYGVLARGEGANAGTLRLVGRGAPARAAGAVAVPVLPPVAASLGAWAALLSGTGAGHTDGAVGWVRPDQPATAAPRRGQPLHAAQVVRRFRSASSRDAGRLAGYLAAAPLWMPVMQLVQRTMLPDSGPAELAEVLLGGLMRLDRNAPANGGPWYAFDPGVQDELLAPLTREEAMLVLKHCSDYIERHFGKGSWNFPAVAAAQLDSGRSGIDWPVRRPAAGSPYSPGGDGDPEEARRARSAVPHPFAEVAAHVLEQFMPLPGRFIAEGDEPRPAPDAVHTAWSLVREYEADGMMQHLLDAVQLLRGAVAADARPGGRAEAHRADAADATEEGRTEVRTTLASCLLRLWEVQGGPGLLKEAEDAARWAVDHSGGARGRAVLAAILHAAADDLQRRGDERGALDLLQRADREYTAACASPGMEPGDALRLTLERVRALETQWRLGHDTALLQSAVGMLEAFSDAWPDQRSRPAALPLALGRTLLRLSGATEDTEQAQLYAKQAARSLRSALGEQSGAHQTGGTQAGTVLDLADALLASGDALDDGLTLVGRALGIVRDDRLSAQLRLREARLRLARYRADEDGGPGELQEAIRAFAFAARGVPRDTAAHADVLAEWGSALLRRASLPDGAEHVHAAVQVLRDCRAETALGDPHQADRLLMLGRALMIRHRIAEDRVDLREAEYLFGLAAREARDPLTAARCWLELGAARLDAHRVLHRPTRLDEAAEAFREAAQAARRAEEGANGATPALTWRAEEAVALQARAHEGRGRTYAEAARPRAARDAYRAAREQWRKLPGGGGEEGQETLDRLAELEP